MDMRQQTPDEVRFLSNIFLRQEKGPIQVYKLGTA